MLGLDKRIKAVQGSTLLNSEEMAVETKKMGRGMLFYAIIVAILVVMFAGFSVLNYRIGGVQSTASDSVAAIGEQINARIDAKAKEYFTKMEAKMAALDAKHAALQKAALASAITEMQLKTAALAAQPQAEGVTAKLAAVEAALAELQAAVTK